MQQLANAVPCLLNRLRVCEIAIYQRASPVTSMHPVEEVILGVQAHLDCSVWVSPRSGRFGHDTNALHHLRQVKNQLVTGMRVETTMRTPKKLDGSNLNAVIFLSAPGNYKFKNANTSVHLVSSA